MNPVTSFMLRWGAALLVALFALVAGPLLDGDLDPAPTEADAMVDIAADLRDAIAQAQAERPDLWNAESRTRAHAAVAIAARHAAAQP